MSENGLSSSLSGALMDGFIGLARLSKDLKWVNVLGSYGTTSILFVTYRTSSVFVVAEIKEAFSGSSGYIC